MSFIAFLFKTLIISLHVGVRMIPVLGITFYSLYMLFIFFQESELALFLIGVIIYMPLLMFLYLCAVRAGLAALGATTAPAFGKLFKGAIRLIRFHFMISNLVVTLVGFGGAALVIWLTNPEFLQVLGNKSDRGLLFDINTLVNDFSNIPAIALIFPSLGVSIAAGLVGTSLGATAAWAAERGPAHDLIWGITKQFSLLFLTATLVLVGPMALLILSLGGPFASVWNVFFLPQSILIGYGAFTLWAICVVAASMAVAYVKNLKDMEADKLKMESEMMGQSYDENGLRELRLSRQARQGILPAE